ncbi:hypothetical protein FRC08_009000 [Ceratobasidium sp. 394]|nr:hypothetical protein FRC08_009000 [Ceratobasidium sp. 394]
MSTGARRLPECWGHRGASAAFPENTLASFEAAIRDGAEGIESDVHVSLDDVVLMFHDPSLGRTTDGRGLIREKNWVGDMENTRTVREPKQAIPTFAETVELLMRPENQHAQFNAGKKLLVWTVNKKEEMIEAARWGVDVILTDVTSVWLTLRAQLQADFETTSKSSSRWFLWTSPTYYYPVRLYAW